MILLFHWIYSIVQFHNNMRNARAHKLQWSGPTVHSCIVISLNTVLDTFKNALECNIESLCLKFLVFI